MSSWVDVQYANMLSPYVRNFKRKSDVLWNFSCPVCGDSPKNPTKARGFLYQKNMALFYKCHKCGYGTTLGSIIKQINPALHKQYIFDKFRSTPEQEERMSVVLEEPKLTDVVLDSLRTLNQLPANHPALDYVAKRKIPKDHYDNLYFAPKFYKFVLSIFPDRKLNIEHDHPRLVIPYFNAHGKCFAFQGRAFGNEEPKYMMFHISEDGERIYGLDRIDFSKRVYAVEGPVDSLFLPNTIAVSGSTFGGITLERLKSNLTVVFDNERRSPTLTKLIEKAIGKGFSVCLWPDTVEEKDINEMILSGRTPQEILDIIDHNTYSGTTALLRFTTWKRV